MDRTERACADLTAGVTKAVLKRILTVVHISEPALARAADRISLTCRYSAGTSRPFDHVTVTTVSGRLAKKRFVRLVTFGVIPRPSKLRHVASTALWEWDPAYAEAGVLSMLHDGRVTIVQVAIRGAAETKLKANALRIARSLHPEAV